MARRVFVRGTGQEDNIGDVVLRRALFDRLRQAGELHIYLADASTDFIASLELGPRDEVYRDMRTWKIALLRSLVRRSTWFVDKPGEVLLTSDIYKGQRSLLPLLIAVRLRGGRVLRLGVGQRSPNPDMTPSFRRLYRISNAVLWRDSQSASDFGIGNVMPDWGFEAPRALPVETKRDLLVVSYRGDRPELSQTTLDRIRAFAVEHALEIVAVTQVQRDGDRSDELARALGGVAEPWPLDKSHAEQERDLRNIYRRTAMVLSDRLHVLIVAATEGAVPVNLVEVPDIKVARHFDVIGYRSITVAASGDGAGRDQQDVSVALSAQMERADEIKTAMETAARRIEELSAAVLGLPIKASAPVV